ncbi:hypothetical protein I4U23_018200 [Adineta vaga]|nr:hypothetical protein I4U23_018200 [Adineta vaga]
MILFISLLLVTCFHPTTEEWMSSINPLTFSRKTIEHLLNNGGYAIISAGRNPAMLNDLYLSDYVIQQRTNKLIDDIKDFYIYSSIIGSYDGGIERSFFLILHNESPQDELEELFRLGEKYNQDSIIYVKKSKPVIQQLIYTTGHYRGRYVKGNGYERLQSNVTDNFSRVHLCSNITFEFTLKFNFNIMYRDKIVIQTDKLLDYHHKNQQANKQRCRNL